MNVNSEDSPLQADFAKGESMKVKIALSAKGFEAWIIDSRGNQTNHFVSPHLAESRRLLCEQEEEEAARKANILANCKCVCSSCACGCHEFEDAY